MEVCVQADPPDYPVGTGHTAKCYLYSDKATEKEKKAAEAAGLAASTRSGAV
jgi:hypothetical protein